MFLSAFFMGLVSSMHCVGMCGPLTLLVPQVGHGKAKFVLGRLLYNAGRLITYSFLGGLVGFFGENTHFFLNQRVLSMAMGLSILVYLLLPSSVKNRYFQVALLYRQTNVIKSYFGKLFKAQTHFAQLLFGIINGFLPCGLIYAALALAFLMTMWWQAALFMLSFGLGTVPLMLPVSLGFSYFKKFLGRHFKKILTLSYAFMAVWLVFRGFHTNISTLYTSSAKESPVLCLPKF
jgi:uncharacterized protein